MTINGTCVWCDADLGAGHNSAAFRGSEREHQHSICFIARQHQQNTPLLLLLAVEQEKPGDAAAYFKRWTSRRLRERQTA